MPDLATALRDYVDQAPAAVHLEDVIANDRKMRRRRVVAMTLSSVALVVITSLAIIAVQNANQHANEVVSVAPSIKTPPATTPTTGSGRGRLGVTVIAAPAPGSGVTLPRGAEVSQSLDPAKAAGVRKGDVITAVNGKAITSTAQLNAVLAPLHPGDVVALTWTDKSRVAHTATVTLGRYGA